MSKFYTTLTMAIVIAFACKSPAKLYNQGNYNDAIDASIKKLQKDPYDPEYRDILIRSYSYAVQDNEDRIRSLANTSSETKFAEIYHHYDQLQSLYEKMRRYPAIAQMIKPTDYSSYLETYRLKASEVHVERGLKWMEGEDKRSYREAYREFRLALRYKPNDIDIKRKLEEAYDNALVRILVVPMDAYNSSYYYSNSSYQMRNFQDQLIRGLSYNSGSEFIKFYTENEMRNKGVEPDELVEMRMGRLNIGQSYDQNSNRQVSKEVVVKETVYKRDSVVKEYQKVFARITSTKRILVSDVEMYVTTREPGGRIIWSDNFRSEHRWQTEFATYTGDERALTDNDKNLLNTRDTNVPNQDEIADLLLKRLEKDLTHKLRNYYNRYQ